MSKHQRRQIFIDRPLQVAVMLRAFLYWSLCLVAQLGMVAFIALITSSQEDFIDQWPRLSWHLQITFLASVVLLPIILLDVLKLSHRWVGPIFRLRNSLQALGQGKSLAPIKFRDRDFWQDLANDLNAVAAELERRKASGRQESADEPDGELVTMSAVANHEEPAAAMAP